MKFFTNLVASVSMLLAGKAAFQSLMKFATAAQNAVDISECREIAKGCSKTSELLSKFGQKSAALAQKLDDPLSAKALSESSDMAVGALRMMSAYYLHVGQSEPFGDFLIEQALDLESKWRKIRTSAMDSQTPEQGSKVFNGLAKLLSQLAVASISVGLRAHAERLALNGELTPEIALDLAERVRSSVQDSKRIGRAATYDKLKRLEQSQTPAARAEASKLKLTAAESVAGETEEAQVFFLAGMKDKARDVLAAALSHPTQPERDAALLGLSKEMRLARGNGQAFRSWVKSEMSLPADSNPAPMSLSRQAM